MSTRDTSPNKRYTERKIATLKPAIVINYSNFNNTIFYENF